MDYFIIFLFGYNIYNVYKYTRYIFEINTARHGTTQFDGIQYKINYYSSTDILNRYNCFCLNKFIDMNSIYDYKIIKKNSLNKYNLVYYSSKLKINKKIKINMNDFKINMQNNIYESINQFGLMIDDFHEISSYIIKIILFFIHLVIINLDFPYNIVYNWCGNIYYILLFYDYHFYKEQFKNTNIYEYLGTMIIMSYYSRFCLMIIILEHLFPFIRDVTTNKNETLVLNHFEKIFIIVYYILQYLNKGFINYFDIIFLVNVFN